LFFLMICASIFLMLFTDPGGVLSTMLSASSNGLQLALTLCGIYIVWMGIVQIAIDAGIIDKLAKLLSPVTGWLFGKQTPEVNALLATNISANMIGAGAAATPAAIRAIELMNQDRPKGSDRPTTPMIMLFILSATSMQILPTTVIGILSANNATNASNVILPTFIVSTVTTLIGVLIVKWYGRKDA